MIYTINIVTNTKTTDIYDAVAINKYPIIFDNENLEDIFEDEEFIKYCKELIKTENVYEHSKLYIQEYDSEAQICVRNVCDLKDKIKLEL